MSTIRRQRRAARIGQRNYAIGLVVIAVVGVLVYVSYTSTNGLPFESTYDIAVDLPNGNRLVATNQVRIDGVRIGRVKRVAAMPATAGGQPFTRAWLALERSVDPVPTDTTIQVRPSSALGATYVDLAPGRAARTVPSGGRLPMANSRRTVDLVDLLDVFDRATSRGIQRTFQGLGNGFAGRGRALNEALGGLARLMPSLEGASRALAAPRARLGDFVRGYESFATALGPVGAPLARFMTGASATFGALSREGRAVGDTIEAFPPAERATTAAFTRLGPQLRSLATLMRDLRAGVRPLRHTLRRTNAVLERSVVPLRATPRFARSLGATLDVFGRVARRPATGGTLRKLRDVLVSSREILEVLTPAQVHCNVIGLFGVDFGKIFTFGGGDAQGLGNFAFTSGGATLSILQNAEPSNDLGVNYLPNENAEECESGHEPSPVGGPPRLTNPPGAQSRTVPLTVQPPGVRERAIRAGLQSPQDGP